MPSENGGRLKPPQPTAQSRPAPTQEGISEVREGGLWAVRGRDFSRRAGALPSISPVDGSVLGWYPSARPEDAAASLERLRGEAGEWRATPLRERLRLLRRLRERLAAEADPLARLLARESGKPLVEAYGAEILPTLHSLAWLERNSARVLAPERLRRFPSRRVQEWEPYGVIGLISPWNYPLFLTLPVIAAALAAGNAVLWKPSELALGASAAVYDILREAGLGHLVASLPGDGMIGEAVVDAGCDKYVLIGSRETGRQVLERLGRQLKPAVAELSGCDPMLVLADADLETAASAAAWGRLAGAGQTCMAPKRLLVERAAYPRFLQLLEERLERVRIGDPLDLQTELGPLRTAALRAEAVQAIEEAIGQGARRLHGGEALPGPGFFLTPALLADCDERMRLFREDLFAPVLAVCPVESLEEAVQRANRSEYGLTASVWTRDRRKACAAAEGLRAGVVCINDVLLPAAGAETPFGGSGESGYGRTRGAAGLREMVRPRVTDGGPPERLPRFHLPPYRQGTVEILRALAAREGASGLGRLAGLRQLADAVRGYGRAGE